MAEDGRLRQLLQWYAAQPDKYVAAMCAAPGVLAFVGFFTSVDVGSVMTKDLYDEGKITDDERTIFVAYQNAGSAIITNLLTTGAPLMAIIPFSFAAIFGVCMFCKLLGANVMRLILAIRNPRRKEVPV